MDDLQKEVKELFESAGGNIYEVEQNLLQTGHLKQDVEEALHKFASSLRDEKSEKKKSESRKFFLKEIFDRIGYGFGSEQYVNILFFQSGAAYPIIALANGIKAILTSIVSSFIKDYSSEKGVDRRTISSAGILYGYCFIMMAIGVLFQSPLIFFIAIILGAIGVVSYGEFYQQFMQQNLSTQKEGIIAYIYRYGLFITMASLVAAAYLMDRFQLISLPGELASFGFFSYLAIFEIAALLFILSGYVVSQLKSATSKKGVLKEIIAYIPEYLARTKSDLRIVMKNKAVVILTLATSLTAFVQMLGNAFYGIFIYQNFSDMGFGPFLNVAMVSVLALFTSLLTPLITKENTKLYGKYPMLIFGTALMAIMPLAFYHNPNLRSIGMGTILGVAGAAIVGIANGMLCAELVPKDIKASFFGVYTIIIILPYLITVPLGACLVSLIGLSNIFLLLAVILILLVLPMYFVLMLSPKLGRMQQNAKL